MPRRSRAGPVARVKLNRVNRAKLRVARRHEGRRLLRGNLREQAAVK